MTDVRKIHVVYICNFVSSIDWQIRFVKTCSWWVTASSVWNRPNMTVMLVILWVFALLRCALGWKLDDDDDMMCISLFSYGRPAVVRCKGFGWVWVGLGQLFGGLGWAGSMKIDPRTTLWYWVNGAWFRCVILSKQRCLVHFYLWLFFFKFYYQNTHIIYLFFI